jgi:hypothetical protein
MMYKNNETRCFYENIKIELNRLLSFQTVLFEVISGSTPLIAMFLMTFVGIVDDIIKWHL